MITKQKKEKKEFHTFPMYEQDLTKELWYALLELGTKLTFEPEVIGETGNKELMVNIGVLVTQGEWDKLNRKLGKLGFDELPETENKD
jgi:hypothetical protein